MNPEALASLLSDYFTEMVEVVFEHGGTLDKFVGDALMALWGAPMAQEDAPDRAVRAAIAMQEALAHLNARWVAAGRPGSASASGSTTARCSWATSAATGGSNTRCWATW